MYSFHYCHYGYNTHWTGTHWSVQVGPCNKSPTVDYKSASTSLSGKFCKFGCQIAVLICDGGS